MISIIIATHGKFSEELVRTAEMIFGEQENVVSVNFQPGESADDLVVKFNDVLKTIDTTEGVLFMVDLFGGSPFNAASRIVIENENMDIITGVNLPMLLETYGLRSIFNIKEIISSVKQAGQDGIVSFKEKLEVNEEEEL